MSKTRRKRQRFAYGQKYGEWTVVGLKPQYPRGSVGSHWLCRCKCGDLEVLNASNLRSGRSTKCVKCKAKHLSDIARDAASKDGRTVMVNGTWIKPCECGAAKSYGAKHCDNCRERRGLWSKHARSYASVADEYGITKQAVHLTVKRLGWIGMLAFYRDKYNVSSNGGA